MLRLLKNDLDKQIEEYTYQELGQEVVAVQYIYAELQLN